ncbi:hypothetical protein ACJEEU_08095, partial [Bacteroides salyersiae]|uniref:hypothetical protein n=1 Tax=Bacteroides salyersiae TaxID=291644 RepID=UPI00397E129A
KLLNKKYGTHTESRILHLHKIFYSASFYHPSQTFIFSVPIPETPAYQFYLPYLSIPFSRKTFISFIKNTFEMSVF